MRCRPDAKGFSTLEVVLVMVMMGIFSTVVIPRVMDSVRTLELNDTLQKLRASIRYVRELALSTHQVYGIEFSTANNTYRLFTIITGAKSYIKNPINQKTNAISLGASGVTMSAANRSEIRFDAFGNPTDSGGTILTFPTSVTLLNSSGTRSVHIFEQTGFTQVVTDGCQYTGIAGGVYQTAC